MGYGQRRFGKSSSGYVRCSNKSVLRGMSVCSWKACSAMSSARPVGCARRRQAILGRGGNRREKPTSVDQRLSAAFANSFNSAIESDVRRIAVLLDRIGCFGLSRRSRNSSFRRAMMRPSNDRGGYANRDHYDCQKRSHPNFHLTFRFSALSLPLFGTMSNVTLSPSRRSFRPAFSTAEIWTNTSLPPPPSGAMNP